MFTICILALAACGSSTEVQSPISSAAPVIDPSASEVNTGDAAAASSDESVIIEPEVDPIDEEESPASLLYEVYGTNEQVFALRKEAENLTAICMAALGWDYLPAPDPSLANRFELDADPDFRDRWGYGITTVFDEPDNPLVAKEFVNPNQEIMDGLSEQALTAYLTDLFGQPSDESEDAGVQPVPSGCAGESTVEAFSELPLYFDLEANEAVFSIYDQLEQDTRVIEAAQLWSNCMLADGYRYETSADISTELSQALEELNGETGDALEQLQLQELELAATDYNCREGEFNQIVDAARAEYEAEFRTEFGLD